MENEAGRRRYSGDSLNAAFNDFLNIQQAERDLLCQYHDTLLEGGEQFAKVFFDYLLHSDATATTIEQYQQHGGNLEHLVEKQLAHFNDLISGDTSAVSAQRLEHIGKVHYQHAIEPVWIMGAYLRYQEHLFGITRHHGGIADKDRTQLEDAIGKVLFRDMGLVLEGYWHSGIHALDQEQAKVSELQTHMTSLPSNIPQLLWSIDVTSNQPVYISPNINLICGREVDMPIPCINWTIEEDREIVTQAWARALDGKITEVESRVRDPDGNERWFRRVFHPYRDQTGKVIRIDGIMEDATDSKEALARLHTLATTDSLTGLLNRALLTDRLYQAIAVARRQSSMEVALIIMDLDQFKEINDALGHPAGDEILVMAAQRLKEQLRESDTLARLGGDEFAIMVSSPNGRALAQEIARKALLCFSKPFHYQQQELYLGVSIGIALFPEHGDDVNSLMSRADVAMYNAKRKNMGYLYYDASRDPNTQSRLLMISELRRAMKENQLELYFQPKIKIDRGIVEGVEALLRWHHPTRGIIMPDDFIPLAESAGLMSSITDWVIRTAGRQCRQWHEQGYFMRLAVNISGRVFQDPKLLERIKDALESIKIPPGYLEIEITENELMSDISYVSKLLSNLSQLGVSIAIDDFGTGYSSLAYIKELPLDTLKIDKSFVLNMANDDSDAVIVHTMIDLAHNLGRNVVAEGIEDSDTWDLLAILGCDTGQGFYISHPLPAGDFNHWLKTSPWHPLRFNEQ
ncbi:MAG: hypothetical protein BMS9Abin36_0454 [Gammaproteobacteria bacterium]|nr:MAG: hypothetical protein BMS9Abin36_0454 [Gammaproteobacteria bacterium]